MIHFLDVFPNNLGAVSEEQGMILYPDIKEYKNIIKDAMIPI